MEPGNPLRFLTDEDVLRAVSMTAAIQSVKEAFIALSSGKAVAPARTRLDIPEHRTTALVMPAYLPGTNRLGLKLIALSEDNPSRGLPLAHAVALLMDAEKGTPLAVLEARALTAIRTGAASGAATDALARKDARVAAIFGCGVQGRTQLEALATVRPLLKAYAFDADPKAASRFAEDMSRKLDLEVVPAPSPRALREADVISTATTSSVPVFSDGDLKPGVHINAVGSYKPHVREVPEETVQRARIFVDERQAALEEAGDLIIPLEKGLIGPESILAEIGEVLAGRKAGRTSDDDVTLFKSVGHAVQDLAVADLVVG